MWLIRTLDFHSQWIPMTGESLHPWNECSSIPVTRREGAKNALGSLVKNTPKEWSGISCSWVWGWKSWSGRNWGCCWELLHLGERKTIAKIISWIFGTIFRKSDNMLSVLSCSNSDFCSKSLLTQPTHLLGWQLALFVPAPLQWRRQEE